jgi:hypothetical protein
MFQIMVRRYKEAQEAVRQEVENMQGLMFTRSQMLNLLFYHNVISWIALRLQI